MDAVVKFLRGDDKVSSLTVLAIAVIVAVLVILFLPDILPQASPEHLWPSVVFPLIFFGVFIVVPVIWGVITKQTALRIGPSAGKMAGMGLAIGLGGLLLAVAYAALAGTLSKGASGSNLLLILLGTPLVLYQCAAEEIYFRGWIQPVISRTFGPWAGVGLSAVLFALMHVLAGVVGNPVSFINVALAGLLFGLLAWRTDGLVAPILAHFAWNWAEGVLFGLSPNPGSDVWTAVIDLDMTGSALWGGSAEGLNASLGVTIVMMALCLPLAFWKAAAGAGAQVEQQA